MPDLLSRVAKLEEVGNSATCVADTSQISNSFHIEETTSFESLVNISADEEVLPEATEALLDGRPSPLKVILRSEQSGEFPLGWC